MIDGSANAMNKCWFSWSCIYIQSSVWDSDEDDSRVDHMRFVQLERHICRVLQMIWRHVSLVLKMNQSHQTFSDFCGNICALLWFGWEVCPDTFKTWRADYGLILQTAQCLCGWTWNYSDSLLEFHPFLSSLILSRFPQSESDQLWWGNALTIMSKEHISPLCCHSIDHFHLSWLWLDNDVNYRFFSFIWFIYQTKWIYFIEM